MLIYQIGGIDWGDVFHGRSSRGCGKDHVGGNPWQICKYDLNCSRNGCLSEEDSDEEYQIVWCHEIPSSEVMLPLEWVQRLMLSRCKLWMIGRGYSH